MSDVPAGWYDDPEQASQYRYWDGAIWTEHRAPKNTPPTPRSLHGDDGPFDPVSKGIELLKATWIPLLVIGLIAVAFAIVAGVMAFAAFEIALNPGIFDIVDEVTKSNWDPAPGTADRAYLDDIEFDANASAILLFIAAVIVGYTGSLTAYFVAVLLLAATYAGRPLGSGRYVAIALRRLPRWIGIYILWGLVSLAPLAVVVGLWFAAVQAPALLLLVIPATVALIVFVWPYIHLSFVTLALAPTDDPPFRRLLTLMRDRWGHVALRVFLLNVVLFAMSIAGNVVGVIPIAGIVAALAIQGIVYALSAAASVVIYTDIGGPLADDLLAPTEGSPPTR